MATLNCLSRTFGESILRSDGPSIQNDLANAKAGFAALAKYRLWRRAGQEVRFTTEGKTLALTNTALLTVRGRYAGKLVDSNAFAWSDNWQA